MTPGEQARADGWCEHGIAWLEQLPLAVDRAAVVASMAPVLAAIHASPECETSDTTPTKENR